MTVYEIKRLARLLATQEARESVTITREMFEETDEIAKRC